MARQRNEQLLTAAGARLRKLREAKGLSQEKVLFQQNAYLSCIENGSRNITMSTLYSLCQLYGISMRDFFKELDRHDAEVTL